MENHELLLEEHEFNLSDFALFLSVMKNPRAYEVISKQREQRKERNGQIKQAEMDR